MSSAEEGIEGCGALTGAGRVSRVLIISLLSVLVFWALLVLLPLLSEDLLIVFLIREKSDVVFAISDRLDSIGLVL